ncbi:MAG: pilus assembly PilX N-terminal domain-containing protein [Polyangiaceae bacterium]|nr:pilus assembly PilX N-terminal domain-containing protein [Polyangiaceae bacterium]MCW5790758.1 pilus assembly PilX N-terminal domain-containing protein [Polyangiaceae bacterium]
MRRSAELQGVARAASRGAVARAAARGAVARAAARRGRGDERGAALFVVVLVITLLTAIGIFSARAASLVNVASGYNRQAVQTQYIAEYGVRGVTTRMARGEADAILSEMVGGVDTCEANAKLAALTGQRASCYKLYMQEVSAALETPLLELPTTTVPGSLGPPSDADGQMLGNFVVELTEQTKAPGALAGFQVDGQNPSFQLVRLTLTAQGAVRPFTAGTACDDGSSRAAGVATMRSHVVTLVGAHH